MSYVEFSCSDLTLPSCPVTVAEEKAREADKNMREKARVARIEYKESLRRTTQVIQAAKAFTSTPPNKPPLPPKLVNLDSI